MNTSSFYYPPLTAQNGHTTSSKLDEASNSTKRGHHHSKIILEYGNSYKKGPLGNLSSEFKFTATQKL